MRCRGSRYLFHNPQRSFRDQDEQRDETRTNFEIDLYLRLFPKFYNYFSISAGVGGGPAKKKIGIEIGKNAAEKSGGLFSAEDW
jgi:hypothetical protein